MAETTLPKLKSNIYKLDNFFFDVNNLENQIINLVDDFSRKEEHYSYSQLTVKNEYSEKKEFSLLLFVSDNEERDPEWLDFVNHIIIDEESENTEHLVRKYPSFLLFLYNNKSIYCITKGAGHYVINESIVPDFGIQVLECLVDDQKTELRRANERGVIGPILQRSRFFRGNYKLSDERSIGMFYKDIEAYIDKKKLKKYLNIDTDKAALVIGGKSSLEINAALNINELYDRILNIDELLNKRERGEFKKLNKFQRVSQKILDRRKYPKAPTVKMKLKQKILETLYENLKNVDYDLELYHPSIVRFSEVEYFTFTYYDFESEPSSITLDKSCRITIRIILNEFDKDISQLIKAEFIQIVENIKGAFGQVESLEEPNIMFNWINSETVFDGDKYFFLDGDWFLFEEDFKEQASTDIGNLFKKLNTQSHVLMDWKKIRKTGGKSSVNEGVYNLTYRDKPNFVVCDKVLLDNIEICDFFEMKEDKVTLFHVKNGLGTSTRVVYNQIMNGAALLNNLRSGNKVDEIEKYYKGIKKQSYNNRDLDKYLINKLLTVKEIEFCLVYATEKDVDREQELKNSNSFIAKLSILQCEHDLRANFDFKFNLAKIRLVEP